MIKELKLTPEDWLVVKEVTSQCSAGLALLCLFLIYSALPSPAQHHNNGLRRTFLIMWIETN